MPEEKKEEALTEVIKDEDVVKTTIDAKELKDTDELYMFKCTQCGGVHFRHAGYMEMLLPYVLADKQKKIQKESHQVHVCVKCKKSFKFFNTGILLDCQFHQWH